MVQLFFAIFIALSHTLATVYMKPYAKQSSNAMAISSSLLLVFIFLACVPIKLQLVFDSGIEVPPQLLPFVHVPNNYVVRFLVISTFGAISVAVGLMIVTVLWGQVSRAAKPKPLRRARA